MVSLPGPICQATPEQLVSTVLSRTLFTFPSCQQGDALGNRALQAQPSTRVRERKPRALSERIRHCGTSQP